MFAHRWMIVKRATIAGDSPTWDQRRSSTWRFPPTPNRLKLHLVRRATFGGILVLLCLHDDKKNTVIHCEVRAKNKWSTQENLNENHHLTWCLEQAMLRHFSYESLPTRSRVDLIKAWLIESVEKGVPASLSLNEDGDNMIWDRSASVLLYSGLFRTSPRPKTKQSHDFTTIKKWSSPWE